MIGHTDVRSVLPLVSCPTLMVHNRGDFGYPPELGRFVAEHVAHGTFVELPYDKIYSWSGEAEHAALDHVERFVREELGVATATRPAAVDDGAVHRHRGFDPHAHARPATKPGGGD